MQSLQFFLGMVVFVENSIMAGMRMLVLMLSVHKASL
jgi:hypothetical protein